MTRHPVDLLSFSAGLLVLAIGLLLLTGGFDGLRLEWAGPIAAIGVGVLIAFAARPEHRATEEAPNPTTDA